MSSPARLGGSRDGLPDVNDLVRVNVAGSGPQADEGGAAGVPTRVENVLSDEAMEGGRRYLIAAPQYRGDSELPSMGTVCTLEWPGAQGLWILPVTFAGEELAREGLRVWAVDARGAARRLERRSHVRVAWSLPVTMTTMSAAAVRRAIAGGLQGPTMVAEPTTDEPVPDSFSGWTSNISEGGIRVLLPAPRPPADLGVTVHLEVSGEQFDLPARVRWVRPHDGAGALPFEAAVAFDDPDHHGDRLRPLLFAEQLRMRRAGLA